MRVDLRVKHDIEARKAAIGLFERGHGFESAAKALSVPRDTVRQWLYVYRSFGSEVLLSMDGKQARYTYEQKVAAASAVVDGGMSGRDAVEAFGVMVGPMPSSVARRKSSTFTLLYMRTSSPDRPAVQLSVRTPFFIRYKPRSFSHMKNVGWFTFEGVEYCYLDSTGFLSMTIVQKKR